MIHYNDESWRKVKEQEVVDSQACPDALLSLTFKKDDQGWYADVPEHTRAQNAMVAGADGVIERMAQGKSEVTIKFRTVAPPESGPLGKALAHMKRVEHDSFGATYLVFGLSKIPVPAWLCNVTETVLGEHPKNIWIYRIEKGD